MKVPAAVLALFAAAGAPAAPSLAQTLQPVPLLQQPGVYRSTASLVALTVTVQDKSAKYVAGLQPDDFVVYEDGVKQELRFFEAEAVPVDLIVLIDTSSSMSDKVRMVHEAASGFLRTLREGDRGAVVGFAEAVAVLQPLTSDHALLEQAVRKTGARGATALNNAVYIALKQFGRPARGSEVRRQAIVVLSDGADTSSLVSLDDVLGVARQTGVTVYTVAMQGRRPHGSVEDKRIESDSDRAMKMLARETGAQSFFPEPSGLKGVYASIATELANQYSIGYIPANNMADGAFRRVVVQVVTKAGLRPRTRQGYTAAAGLAAMPAFSGIAARRQH